jgi:xylulokinase
MDPRARGAFLGLTARHERGDLVRAVMEGVTLALFDAFAVLVEQGASPERIVMAGGGARSPFWRQLVADVFGLPVHALATADQAAMGAALLAATGVRDLDPIATAHAWANYASPQLPDPRRHARYQELLGLFRDAYGQVIELSHRLGGFT